MMKKYKEGDTIYLRGTVTSVDTGFRTKADMTYQVSFSNPKSSLTPSNKVWVDDNCVIEEPIKPGLPKGVADELEDAKQGCFNFIGYINKAIDNDYPETNGFVYLANVGSDEMIKVLLDAWYYGYTIKPETKLYNLLLGYYGSWVSFYKVGRFGFDIAIDKETDEDNLKHDDSYQFTQEEIDKYNEDEDSWFDNKLDLNKLKVEVKN